MRWRRRQREAGRLPSLGQDYTEAHRRYVQNVGEGGELWLRRKPFSAPPRRELVECLRVFSHIVTRLRLGLRAQVLDVGCGPGWLSEYLARCGYAVTGVDVSEDMVQIARERVAAIEQPVWDRIEPLAEFHAMSVLKLPWTDRFDAAILYDAMHHFHDEVETLRVIRCALVPGGRIFIHEGVRPAPGSEGERELIAEMEQYGTLESPFDPDYLVFRARTGRLHAGLPLRSRGRTAQRRCDRGRAAPRRGPGALPADEHRDRVQPRPCRARSQRRGVRCAHRGARILGPVDGRDGLALPIRVSNAGRVYWPSRVAPTPPLGSVTIGPYHPAEDGGRIELPRQTLPHSLSPGQSVDMELHLPRTTMKSGYELRVEAVREGIAWFADYGSTPLVVSLPHGV